MCSGLDYLPVRLFYKSLFNFNEMTDQQRYSIASKLYCSDQIFQYLFDYTFYAINFMLAHDLVNTVKNPFDSLDKRRKRIWFYGAFIIYLIFPYWIVMGLLGSNMISEIPICGDFRFVYISKPFEAIVLFIYFFYAIYACLFAA